LSPTAILVKRVCDAWKLQSEFSDTLQWARRTFHP